MHEVSYWAQQDSRLLPLFSYPVVARRIQSDLRKTLIMRKRTTFLERSPNQDSGDLREKLSRGYWPCVKDRGGQRKVSSI
jgi:hypothetical protein